MNFKRFHESKNLFDPETRTTQANLVNGVVDTSLQYSGYYVSDYILIESDNVSINNARSYGWYDENKNLISYENKSTSIFRNYSKPNGAVYVRLAFVNGDITPTNVMVVDGNYTSETMPPFEPYGNTWTDTPHYIHNTSTDTITTLPADIYANDNNATIGLKGNMEQSSTPSPTTPIQPQECGERTGNLLNLQEVADAYPNDTSFDGITLDIYGGTTNLFNRGITVDFPSGCYFSCIPLEKENASTNGRVRFIYTDDTVKEVYITKSDGTPSVGRGEIEKPVKSLRFNWSSFNSGFKFKLAIINKGSTALPYEPYGVKIPISSANTTTPVYLGEVQTERKIGKYIFTGQENIIRSISGGKTRMYYVIPGVMGASPLYCTHYPETTESGTYPPENTCRFNAAATFLIGVSNDYTTADDYKTWLQQQYANGTPVTVWYVLATPQTAVVNEPLRKIGDYADTVSGITIPVIAGANILTVDTTLQPSEITVNYKGWHLATSIKNYIHNGMDIITTLPVTISADGNAFVGLQGNMTQSGTPTPATPIQPQECGDKTGNLLNINRTISTSFTVDESICIDGAYPNSTITSSNDADITIVNGVLKVTSYFAGRGAGFVIAAKPNTNYTVSFDVNKAASGTKIAYNTMPTATTFDTAKAEENTQFTISTKSDTQYIIIVFRYPPSDGEVEYSNIMVVEDSTALPYEPYGYKIPISSASTTTPVYLGEVETVRKIKKLVLDGTEDISINNKNDDLEIVQVVVPLSDSGTITASNVISDHFATKGSASQTSTSEGVAMRATGTAIMIGISFITAGISTSDSFAQAKIKVASYLVAQYAAGTPVTVWYVLATETTGILNEPLRKIGDYADEVLDITIPTITVEDIIDVETTLKPSKMKIKYNSWHDGNISYLLTDSPLCGIETYKDELNLATGACTRQIKKLVLDDTTVFSKGGSGSSAYFVLKLGDSVGTECVCTHFINTPITASNTDIGTSITASSKNLRIRPENVTDITAEQFNQWISAQYAAGTPVTVWYVLAEPTTETITVPTGLFGTEEGYLNQSSTPTPTNPIYPTANGVPLLT